MMRLIKDNNQIAFPAFSYFISLINYYSFSSFNTDQIQNNEVARKNTERLENQPMINELLNYLRATNLKPTFKLQDVSDTISLTQQQGYVGFKTELFTLLNSRTILRKLLAGKLSIQEDLNKLRDFWDSGDRRRSWVHQLAIGQKQLVQRGLVAGYTRGIWIVMEEIWRDLGYARGEALSLNDTG